MCSEGLLPSVQLAEVTSRLLHVIRGAGQASTVKAGWKTLPLPLQAMPLPGEKARYPPCPNICVCKGGNLHAFQIYNLDVTWGVGWGGNEGVWIPL